MKRTKKQKAQKTCVKLEPEDCKHFLKATLPENIINQLEKYR